MDAGMDINNFLMARVRRVVPDPGCFLVIATEGPGEEPYRDANQSPENEYPEDTGELAHAAAWAARAGMSTTRRTSSTARRRCGSLS